MREVWGADGTDFSNPDWRKQFFSTLCNADDAKKIGLLHTKHQSLFHHQVKKIIKEKGGDPRSYGMSSTSQKFVSSGGGMQGVVTPKPKQTDKVMGDPKNQQIQSSSQTGMTPATQGQGQQSGQMEQPEPRINFTTKTTGLTIKMMFNLLRLKFPALDGLDDDEVEMLGEAWNPIFNKYLAGVAGMWMTALFSTGMILTSKVADAKKKDPEAFGKKKGDKKVKDAIDKDNEETTDESYEQEESKDDGEQSGWLSKMGTDKADKRTGEK